MAKRILYTFIIIATLVGVLAACHKQTDTYYGYVEARLIYLTTPVGGTLKLLTIRRGERVTQNQLLFRLDQQPEVYDLQYAIQNAQEAAEQLQDLQKGKRPTEIDAIQAQIEQSTAELTFLSKEIQRHSTLVNQGAISPETYDLTLKNFSAIKGRLTELAAELNTAKLPARANIISAAVAHLNATEELIKKSRWLLAQKTGVAPVNGQVFDTYYEVGERVAAERPILSLLTPKEVYVVFFVPETELVNFKLGLPLKITCDGCKEQFTAKISYISPQAEYTPPVIYSRSARSKLVYRLEASFAPNTIPLAPGQPVDIEFTHE